MLNLSDHPHRRFNPLTREWVLVSPHRNNRPWQGKTENPPRIVSAAHDPECYLCAGNQRASGARNENYSSTYVFDNDFSALLPVEQDEAVNDNGLIIAKAERGICRVVCFSPRHDLTLPLMTFPDIRKVVDVWSNQFTELGSLSWVKHVQIFENRGAMMGASNPHPHCQIWANETLPNESKKELQSQSAYREKNGTCLLCDYLDLEKKNKARIVCENDDFVVLVPFWAVWPYETMLLSKNHVSALDELNDAQRDSLAEILKRLTTRYDNLFHVSFPYTMGFHQRPTDDQPHPELHLHAHYYPPLLRSATIPKFMVGYEMLGSPQRDITAEAAAKRLRSLSEVHYTIQRTQ